MESCDTKSLMPCVDLLNDSFEQLNARLFMLLVPAKTSPASVIMLGNEYTQVGSVKMDVLNKNCVDEV